MKKHLAVLFILIVTVTFTAAQVRAAAPEVEPAAGFARAFAAAADKKPAARPKAAAPAPRLTRLTGDLPAKMPKVSVTQRKGTVEQALRSIARQAGWDLMLTAPASLTGRPLTLQLRNRPAAQVLELILSQNRLRAKLNNKLLVVTPYVAPPGVKVRNGWKSFDDVSKPKDKSKPAVVTGKVSRPNARPSGVGAPMDGRGVGKDRPEARQPEDRPRRRRDRHERRRRRKNDRVVVGQSLRIEKNEEVDSAVAIGGSVTVLGLVHGEAVAIGGSVILEKGGVVRGDAVALGGKIEVKPGGELHGDRVAIGGSLKGVIGFLSGMASGFGAWWLHSIMGTFVRALVLFLLALMILSFMPERLTRIKDYMAENPGASILGGLGLAVGFIPACILLVITIIGIILVPFAILALIALHVVGLTAFMVWLGYKIPLMDKGKSAVTAMIMGLVIVTIIDLIPVVGSLAVAAIAFISAGAVLLSQFGNPPKKVKPAAPDTPAQAPAA